MRNLTLLIVIPSFLISHYSLLATFPAHPFLPDFVNAEAVVAYPFAAVGAEVKVHKGFQIGLFKGDTVFVRPEHNLGFVMLNDRTACLERHGGGFPFLAATIARLILILPPQNIKQKSVTRWAYF
jgi:hypothetical protein